MAGNKTALYSSQNPGGVFSIESQDISTGSRFYVDSVTGSSSYDGQSPNTPKATLAQGIALCTADKGDIVYVMPKHAETTTAIAVDKAGISIIGLGHGRLRPALTATTAATNLLDVSVANVSIKNLRLVGAASGNTALVDVVAADFSAEDVSFEPGATPVMSVTLAAGSARPRFIRCQWLASANGPDCAIDIETSDSDYGVVQDCVFNASGFGWDLGVIRANADAAVGWLIKNCQFISVDTVAIDFNSSAGASGVDGLVEDCTFIATAALASIEDILDPGRYLFKECYAHDITNVTTAAARVPLGTVS